MKRISISQCAWMILAIGACCLSLYVNGLFWWGMSNELLFKTLYTSMGLLFDVAKILSMPFALLMWMRGKRAISMIAFSIFLLLAMVSMLSNISVLQAQVRMKSQNDLSQSRQYELVSTEIKNQQSTIALIQSLMQKDIEQGYRARAMKLAPRLSSAQQELGGLIQKQHNLQLIGEGTSNVVEHDKVIILLGCLLEVVTAFVLFSTREILAFERAKNEPITIESIKNTVTDESRSNSSMKSKNKLKIVAIGGRLLNPSKKIFSRKKSREDKLGCSIDLAEVQTLIAHKKLKPSTRAIRDRFKIGSKSACNVLKALEKRGFLVALRRGYALAS